MNFPAAPLIANNNRNNNRNNNINNNRNNNRNNNQNNVKMIIIFVAFFVAFFIAFYIQKNQLVEEKKRKVEEEKRKAEEEKRKAEEEKRKAKEEKRKAEEDKRKEEEDKRKEEEKINYENEPLKKPIIGIDFESSSSGFSLLIKNSGKDIDDKYRITSEITINKWTEEVVEIGRYSIIFYEENKNDYIYFQDIKINFDQKKRRKFIPKGNEMIESYFPKGYSIKLEIVIKEYLRKLSDIALEKLNNKSINNKYSKKNIKWVIAVPAIWNENAK